MSPRRRKRGWHGQLRGPRKKPHPVESTFEVPTPKVVVDKARARRQQEQNETMLDLIAATKERLAREDGQNWDREVATKDDPMLSAPIWSRELNA